jgi:hypothetical protein
MEGERGHIEYEVRRTDGDPLADFADEPAEFVNEPDSSSLPDRPVNFPRRPFTRAKWVATAVITGGIAAFAAGAFIYVEYPKWSARAAAEKSEETKPADRSPAPIATKGEPTSSATPQNSSAPAVVPPKQARTAEATDSHYPSLTGQWSMNTRVESSALRRYKGLRLQYQLRLQQVGNQITGDGYKSRENDRPVRTKTPITLSGDVVGDRVVLNFHETGTRRKSGGRLVLDRESEDVLLGRFSSEAAKSTGIVEARR